MTRFYRTCIVATLALIAAGQFDSYAAQCIAGFGTIAVVDLARRFRNGKSA